MPADRHEVASYAISPAKPVFHPRQPAAASSDLLGVDQAPPDLDDVLRRALAERSKPVAARRNCLRSAFARFSAALASSMTARLCFRECAVLARFLRHSGVYRV
jgi:hypothetical protein